MMVCSCNGISCRDIANAVDDLMIEDPTRVITPGTVYRALGKRPRCGGCLPNAAELIHKRAAVLRGPRPSAYKHAHGRKRSGSEDHAGPGSVEVSSIGSAAVA